MLNRIWLVTKLELCNLFGINQLRHCDDKKEKSKARGLFVAYIILYAVFGFYSYMYASLLCSSGAASAIPSMFTMIAFVLIVFTTILKAGNVLFNYKSYEKLAPLPIRPIEIVISRFINIYVTSVISAVVFYLPAMILGGASLGAGIGYYLIMLLQIILMPFLAIAVSVLFGTLLMLITTRIKHKNVFKTIFTLLLSVGVVVLSIVGQKINPEPSENFGEMVIEITKNINMYFLPSRFSEEAMVNGSLLSLLFMVLIYVIPFALIALFASLNFVSLCQKLNATRKAKTKKIKETNVSSTFWALTKKELKRLFSCSIYSTNSCFGYILLTIGVIVFPFVGVQKNFLEAGLGFLYARIIVAVMEFMIFLTSTTTVSISMEGKNWWIIKSLPIRNKDIMNSKIATNLIVALPFYIVATIINVVFLKSSNWLDYVVIIVSPLVGIIFTAVFGLYMNLKHPLLIWTNEVEVCKQSKSVGFTMLFSTLIYFAYMAPTLGFMNIVGYIYNLAFSIVLLIIAYMIYRKICKTNLQNIN